MNKMKAIPKARAPGFREVQHLMHKVQHSKNTSSSWKEWTYRDDIWMPQPEQDSNFRGEMALQQCSQIPIFLRLANELDSHIPLLIHPSVNPAMSPRSKLVAYVELWHVSTPLIFPTALDCSSGRDQVFRPRNGSLVFAQREPPLELALAACDLLQPLEILHAHLIN